MRSLFIEAFVRAAVNADLGIAPECLRMTTDHIDSVLSRNAGRFSQADQFENAFKGFLKFTDRMVKEAKARDLSQLQELTFFEAKKQCGIVFWCE